MFDGFVDEFPEKKHNYSVEFYLKSWTYCDGSPVTAEVLVIQKLLKSAKHCADYHLEVVRCK